MPDAYPHAPAGKKSERFILFGVIILLIIAGIYTISKGLSNKIIVPDPAFAAYVSGYTGGVISRNHDILIKLAQGPAKKVQAGDEVPDGLLTFSPDIKGKTIWKDQRTLAFTPSTPMEPGVIYKAVLRLDQLIKVNNKALSKFIFGFQVMQQSFEVTAGHLLAEGPEGLSQYSYEGTILTADEADNRAVEKMLRATFHGKTMPVQWAHKDKTSHFFTISGLSRSAQDQTLHLAWSGKAIDVDVHGSADITLPAKGEFEFLKASIDENQQTVHLFFSDPLDEQQELNGLVEIDTLHDITGSVHGNELIVYPKQSFTGTQEVNIFEGIKNIGQKPLAADQKITLDFAGLKPAVKFMGSGNILPSTEGFILPIEAVNLKSVEIRIIKIFQDKVGQFLQVNDMDGSQQLTRVGRPVLQKTIRLDNMGVKNLGKWNRFTLELSKLIKTEPGAIYQIALAFGKADAVTPCAVDQNKANEDGLTAVDNGNEGEGNEAFDRAGSSYFYDDFGSFYGEDYDWHERDNPCNSAYYNGTRNVIKENILATDIGLTAKRGTDNSLMLIATDLKTAQPMADVTLHIYNYQLQPIATTNTGRDGMAVFNLTGKPFLVQAEYGGQWAYLKLDDGNALSVSQFDVSGSRVQQGIKGFLYGERGVWRPGDSIYLSFMLEDKDHKLPSNHPVVFELTNPKGMLIQRMVRTASEKGLYGFATATDQNAPTGNWTAAVKVGGAVFYKTLKIETVKPNRLKIELQFADDKITPDKQKGKLHVRWLSGAIAGNLKAQYEMILSQGHTSFKGYEKYSFDDPSSHFQTVDNMVFEGLLDAQGNAVIQPAIQSEQHMPATLSAFFKGKIYEPGGNFSVDYQQVPFYTYKKFIGIKTPQGTGYGNMLDLDKKYTVDVATVNIDGQPVSMDSLEVSVYKTRWRWWWEENEDNNANFVNSKYYQQVMHQTISTKNGKGSFALKINAPQWGRYYIRVSDSATGYLTGAYVYFEWSSNYGNAAENMPGGATHLTFAADKQVYKPGDEMKLYIPGSDNARALISIENGSHVLKTYWMDVKKGANAFSVPITDDMAPNIYVSVSEIQPHSQTVNDLPIRQYGIIGIKVENPSTVLRPEITMPAKVRPEEKVSITVQEKTGKPMAYTIAVVDEGLLALTKYKTPKPWDVFYAKEALGVTTWDVYDKVIGAYGARLERLLSIGGDGQAEEETPQSQNLRFKPVVKFFGPYFLPEGKSATHSFTMPNYIGEVRAMVIAGYDGAYGSAEQEVTVKQPLMILPTLPRVAGPDEVISLPVNIFAMQDDVKDITIKVNTDKHFGIQGSPVQQVHLSEPGNTLVTFTLKASELLGAGKVHVEAYSGKYKSYRDIDLTIRNPNPPQVRVLAKTLQAGESWSPEVELYGMKGTNAVALEVSGVPPLNIGRRLSFLIEYPFGCAEQTTSAVFAQLYLDKLSPLTEAQKNNIAANVKAGIHSLTAFQHASGGFTYWPGGNYPDDWVTSYVGHFLLEAKKKGYTVMDDMMKKWATYQTRRANLWKPQHNHGDELIQAYRLYTLAVAEQPDWSAMNRMNGIQELSLQARWRLADAYIIAGRTDVARQLTGKMTTDVADYRSMTYTYGSALRDKAMILETLTDMGAKSEHIYPLARYISGKLNSDQWLSTQETAYSLIALTQFFSTQASVTKVSYSYRVNKGNAIVKETDLPESRVDLPVKEQAPVLQVTNTSEGTLYTNVVIKGTPATGNEKAVQNNLQMRVQYKTLNGKPVAPADLTQGTDFVAEVSLHNPGMQGEYHNLALTQIFPSGWEIRNTRFEGTSGVYNVSTPDYQDIRDDRVYTYFDLASGQTKTFRILLSATYAGKFYLPAVKCAAMYDNNIIAVQPGQWVDVKKQ